MLLIRWITAAALMLTVCLVGAGQVPSAQVAGAGAPTAPQAPQGGRGGGRGGAGAMLYTELCASCHGTGAGPARAVNVLDDAWLAKRDDESLAKAIRDGVPGTDMNSLADKLDAQQIWQIVFYMRTRAADIKGRPEYVPDPDGQIIKSEKQTFKIEVIARELETPWALAFLPDGRLLVTERPGRLRVIEKGQLLPDPVKGTPKVWERQDGGMFDVELHPQYAKNGWIYLSYSETVPNYTPPPPAPAPDPAAAAPPTGRGRGNQPPSIPSMTVIVRGKIKNNEWVEEQVLFRAAPELYTTLNSHYGSRFIFDRQNHLFWTLGERGAMADAQDLSKPTGKIHRVNDDGSTPKDNPFVGKAGAVPTIWTYGNRNPQGLAWDPVTGQLWESEHGPQGGDEINIIQPGKNYGWGVISHGLQPGITSRAQDGMEPPVAYYTPTIAPSGIAFYTGTQYPGWRNSLFVSGLGGQQLRRLEVAGGKVTSQEIVFNQFGRVRDVVQGPDGLFYIALQLPGQSLSQSTPGTVIRLVPVK